MSKANIINLIKGYFKEPIKNILYLLEISSFRVEFLDGNVEDFYIFIGGSTADIILDEVDRQINSYKNCHAVA